MIELMAAIAISSIVMAGAYSAYLSQVQSHNTQQLTVDMLENLRIAMELLQTDLQMAGSDPTGKAGAGFLVATSSSIAFTMDITGGQNDNIDNNGNLLIDEAEEWYDGDTLDEKEHIQWALSGSILQRTTQRLDNKDDELKFHTINMAENIQVFDVVYLDAARNVTADLDAISSVQITLISRSGSTRAPMVFKISDEKQYHNQQGGLILDLSTHPDTFRRRWVSFEVHCRNLN